MDLKLLIFGFAASVLGIFFCAVILMFGRTKSLSAKNGFVAIGLFFVLGIIMLLYSLKLLK